MNAPLAELQKDYDAPCQRIAPVAGHYTFSTEREDNGAHHLEYADGVYHYIVTERGLELAHETFTEKDELLYRLVSDTAFWMSVDHEFKNRVEGQDARRIMFAKWVELMERVGPEFAEKTRAKIAGILEENPYLDR